jgi:hypothetical protein
LSTLKNLAIAVHEVVLEIAGDRILAVLQRALQCALPVAGEVRLEGKILKKSIFLLI